LPGFLLIRRHGSFERLTRLGEIVFHALNQLFQLSDPLFLRFQFHALDSARFEPD
jgi:hypothetical protein